MSLAIDLLVVDDDAAFRSCLLQRFARRGYTVHEAADGGEALGLAERRPYDVAIVDLEIPRLAGLETLARLKAAQPECEIIVLAGSATVATAATALKQGACDYLTKPCSLIECELLVEKAAERRQLSKENGQIDELRHRRPPEPAIVGASAGIREVRRLIEQVGPTDQTVLIEGESGTGKASRGPRLHRRSVRSHKQFVTVDCATLSETLLKRELFGHDRGAFAVPRAPSLAPSSWPTAAPCFWLGSGPCPAACRRSCRGPSRSIPYGAAAPCSDVA